MTAPQERPVAGDGLDREAVRRLHDRIGGLCCRYMTLVAPLSGGTVEQAYRLRDEIMALVLPAGVGGARQSVLDALEAAEAEVARLRAFLQHLADLPIADGQHYAPTCGCAVHQVARFLRTEGGAS